MLRPPAARNRGFLIAAGLDEVVDYLETLRFSPADIDWLKRPSASAATSRSSRGLPLHRRRACHPGRHRCFPNEPLIRITAPLPMAQIVETRLINILHFQTMIATKAARMVLAAPGKVLSTSACAPRTAPRPGCFRRARAISPASAAPRT